MSVYALSNKNTLILATLSVLFVLHIAWNSFEITQLMGTTNNENVCVPANAPDSTLFFWCIPVFSLSKPMIRFTELFVVH